MLVFCVLLNIVVCDFIHAALKAPWLFIAEQNTTDQLAHTDLGDPKYVQLGKCELGLDRKLNTPHPGFVFKRPVAGVHVRLERLSGSDDLPNKLLWDADFFGTAGGPIKLLPSAVPQGGEQPQMLPICARNLQELQTSEFKLSVTELPREDAPDDARFKVFAGEYKLKPRPLGDSIVYDSQVKNRFLDFFKTGDIAGVAKQL